MVRLEPRRSEEGILDRTTRRRGVSMVVVVTQDHVTRRQPCRIPYRLYPSRHALVLFPSKSIPYLGIPRAISLVSGRSQGGSRPY